MSTIRHILSLAKQHEFTNIIIETDSLNTVCIFLEGVTSSHPFEQFFRTVSSGTCSLPLVFYLIHVLRE